MALSWSAAAPSASCSELRRRGVAVLLNSHLLSQVEVVWDRVASLSAGRVVAHGRRRISVQGSVSRSTVLSVRLRDDVLLPDVFTLGLTRLHPGVSLRRPHGAPLPDLSDTF